MNEVKSSDCLMVVLTIVLFWIVVIRLLMWVLR